MVSLRKKRKIGNGGRRESVVLCEGKKKTAFGLSEIRLVSYNL